MSNLKYYQIRTIKTVPENGQLYTEIESVLNTTADTVDVLQITENANFYRLLVIPFPCNTMPYSSSRNFHVTCVAGNDMAMEMEDGLACCFPAVHADVVAIGAV